MRDLRARTKAIRVVVGLFGASYHRSICFATMSSSPSLQWSWSNLRSECQKRGCVSTSTTGKATKAQLLEILRRGNLITPNKHVLLQQCIEEGLPRHCSSGRGQVLHKQELYDRLHQWTRFGHNSTRDLDMLDVFSRSQRCSEAAELQGMKADAFDVVLGEEMDVRTKTGMEILWQKAARVKSGGFVMIQMDCKYWLQFITRSIHNRSAACKGRSGSFAGDTSNRNVRDANDLAAGMASLMRFLHWRGVRVCLENPAGSLLPAFGPMKKALADLGAQKISLSGCRFGWSSQKPLWLYWTMNPNGAHKHLKKKCLHRAGGRQHRQPLNPTLVRGSKNFQKTRLYGSGVYPRKFAMAIVRAHLDE